MMFGIKSSKKKPATYDSQTQEPVIRSSICTGERVVGFRDRSSGQFREVMLIRNDQDLEEFRAEFNVEGDIRTIY